MRDAKSQLLLIMIPVPGMQQRLTWHVRHANSGGGAVIASASEASRHDEQCWIASSQRFLAKTKTDCVSSG